MIEQDRNHRRYVIVTNDENDHAAETERRLSMEKIGVYFTPICLRIALTEINM